MKPNSFTVLHVASGDLWAGAESQLYYLCRELIRTDVRTLAIVFNEGKLAERLRSINVEVTVLDERELSAGGVVRGMVRQLKLWKPDIVHTHGHKESVLACAANILAGRAKSIRTAHGAQENSAPFWKIHKHAIGWLDVFAGRYLQDAIVAVSDPLAAVLARTYRAEKIHVIENGVDVAFIRELSTLKSPVDVSKQFNFAIVGRLVPLKRQDLLLHAAAQMKHIPGWHMLIIGDGPLRTSLEVLARSLDLETRVTFTGAIDPIYPLLRQMSCIVMPSDHEGLPMTLLEAMSLSVPIVAHAVGGIPKLLLNNAGVLVTQHDAAGYSDAIMQLMNSADDASAMALRALERAKSTYDSNVKCSEYKALYARVMSDGRRD